jgi:hypothetical protein
VEAVKKAERRARGRGGKEANSHKNSDNRGGGKEANSHKNKNQGDYDNDDSEFDYFNSIGINLLTYLSIY